MSSYTPCVRPVRQDGVETPIDVETAKQYESWELWDGPDLETRIVAALAARASEAASAPAADGSLSVSQGMRTGR